MRWWRPREPVEPMYIPGRCRTGSSPLRTVMSWAVYEGACRPPVAAGDALGEVDLLHACVPDAVARAAVRERRRGVDRRRCERAARPRTTKSCYRQIIASSRDF